MTDKLTREQIEAMTPDQREKVAWAQMGLILDGVIAKAVDQRKMPRTVDLSDSHSRGRFLAAFAPIVFEISDEIARGIVASATEDLGKATRQFAANTDSKRTFADGTD